MECSSSWPSWRRRGTRRPIPIVACVLAATAVLLTAAEPRPRLIVLLVVDQMRADYVDRFMARWSSGFPRLVNGGAWFAQAAYPYMETFTCAGHATIATGALPLEHGIFQNSWYDRSRGSVVVCADDRSAQPVQYSPSSGRDQRGPDALRLPTLADAMRGNGSRVVSLALKARSAIMLAGHGGTAVTWRSESLDTWETSTAFSPNPVPEVSTYVEAHPIRADFGKAWTRLLAPTAYTGTDADAAEKPPKGWSTSFPHMLSGAAGEPPAGYAYTFQWERSPYADAYIARMAAALAANLRLGQGSTPDLLAVSFSSPDLVGHAFGPRSHELQDMYFQLDRTIGRLLTDLDNLVGPDAYTLALTSDHGVEEIPEHVIAEGGDAGRLDARKVQDTIEEAAARALGPGSHVARVNANDVYLKPGIYEKLAAAPGALDTVRGALTRMPGVAAVFTRGELDRGASSSDAGLRAAALSYVADRSGDLVVSTKPGWLFTVENASHGSNRLEDRRVPIVLFGRGVKPGRYEQPVSPADVAPTLAAIVGVDLTHASGRVLREAMR
ncbi:MAG: alkaline phosphatase family protein [Vicinamibacterales bacterium]